MRCTEDTGFHLIAWTFILSAHLSTVFGVLRPWLGVSTAGVWLQVIFNTLVFFVYYNLLRATHTDPGSVPVGWVPSESSSVEVKKKSREPRFCKKCNALKPARAHHCSYCQRCVLRMDHHCPWIHNCVGHRNHHYFLRFLFFTTIASLTCLLINIVRLTTIAPSHKVPGAPSVSAGEIVSMAMSLVICVPIVLAVGLLLISQLISLASNMTTIEGFEVERVEREVRRGRMAKHAFPYDLGCWRNYTSLLGPNMLSWFFTSVPAGDGYNFEMRLPADVEAGAYEWPPPGLNKPKARAAAEPDKAADGQDKTDKQS